MLKNQASLRESNDIVIARQACRKIARELGFGSADQIWLAPADGFVVNLLTRAEQDNRI